jgi:hypothetical protein
MDLERQHVMSFAYRIIDEMATKRYQDIYKYIMDMENVYENMSLEDLFKIEEGTNNLIQALRNENNRLKEKIEDIINYSIVERTKMYGEFQDRNVEIRNYLRQLGRITECIDLLNDGIKPKNPYESNVKWAKKDLMEVKRSVSGAKKALADYVGAVYDIAVCQKYWKFSYYRYGSGFKLDDYASRRLHERFSWWMDYGECVAEYDRNWLKRKKSLEYTINYDAKQAYMYSVRSIDEMEGFICSDDDIEYHNEEVSRYLSDVYRKQGYLSGSIL